MKRGRKPKLARLRIRSYPLGLTGEQIEFINWQFQVLKLDNASEYIRMLVDREIKRTMVEIEK